jgi:hypothetical protein
MALLKNKQKLLLFTVVWLFALLAFTSFLHSSHLFDSDEGIVLAGAWNLTNGKAIYYDFFEFITPGSFYLVFWFWKLLGVNYWIAKGLAIISLFLSAIGIFKISRLIKKTKLNYLIPFIFIFSSFFWPPISFHTFNLVFLVWSTYFFILALRKKNYNFIISGLLAGVAILFIQHKGIVLVLGCLSFLALLFLKDKKAKWLKSALFYLIATIVPVFFLLQWPIKLLINNLIVFPFFNYSEITKVPYDLLIFCFAVLFWMAIVLRQNKRKEVWFLFYLQIALLFSTTPSADIIHILLVIFPIYILFQLTAEKNKTTKIYLKIIYYSLLLSLALLSIAFFFERTILIPPFTTVQDYGYIEEIEKNCQESEYIYAGPFRPHIYFEARKINPTPFDWLITNHHTDEQFQIASQYLEKYRPACAVLDYEHVSKYHYDKNNPVDNFLRDNYYYFKTIYKNLDLYKRDDL